ncbi:EscC/YscC/HrcC family type III secretion system outer membrane ring protein [Cupriavidus sp. AU9028]|uniref:EscC/YscC/HrcC family type III secretion system outer membrane ring protein n=1 Tax=Cupriavidus sp. AU9028 TaxID=2871157 RepID=UPI001C974161|nr:EscC/YscC/HrcC family type III secretion system outer membrane ring protein [Cupriavidus sp. AU9028]MBY4897888.1 EscC/YscC/HrcC family type III secretion system outer membrane ring protein [Cupriavidus sp. AU9028]
MKDLQRGLLTIATAILMLPVAGVATAAGVPFGASASEFSVSSRGMKLGALLRDLGASFGVPVIVSPEVNDTFVGTLAGRQPDKLLDQLAQLYNLAWYFDGRVLYVYKASQVSNEVLTTSYLDAHELSQALRDAGVFRGGSCAVRPVNNFNAIEVFGVPICVQRVTKLAKDLDDKTLNQTQNQEVVQVFPLRYASAVDGNYTYRDQQVVIPGVVTELREMVRNRAVAPQTGSGQVAPPATSQPTFSADARNNAVIVRDRKANMPLYAELVKQLDQRPRQIEISVAIIDVDAGDMRELGLDFGGSIGVGKARIGFNNGGNVNADGTFSTVLSNTADFFVRINALEQNSRAKVLSRPSVVTLNNVQAVLDRNITFYTKLQGNKVAELASVSAGSLLRVTPRLIDLHGQQEVMLTLDIQDGRQEAPANNIEQLPQVRNSGIATQAILKPGQSLLLGGFVEEKERSGERRVPFLSSLPLVGGLFRNNTRENLSVVRLFLIKAEPHAIQ